MAVTHSWRGDGLTAGVLTTSSAGPGDTPFSEVAQVGGGTNIVAAGNNPPSIQLTAAGNYARWIFASARSQAAYRGVITMPASAPSSNVNILRLRQGSGGFSLSLAYNSFGTLRLFQNGGSQVGATSISLTTNSTYRVELIVNHGDGSTTGTASVYVYDTSGVLLDSFSVTGANFLANHDSVYWGTDATATAMGTYLWDDLAASDTATLIGPAITSLQGRLAQLISSIGADIKTINNQILQARYQVVTLYTNPAGTTWASMPAALTELGGNPRHRIKVNLAGLTQCRMTASVGTAGNTGSELRLQYATDGDTQSSWAYLSSTANSPGVSIATTGARSSGWLNITNGARDNDVWIRVVGINGNGTISPIIGAVTLQLT